ncbi:MAG TPA: ferredoxin [Acidimicrobiales bacterium]|nr:ferredoxin [Acidimicrobiales bacterium]
MTARMRIDPTQCRGHAICALYVADAVEIDRWGFGRVVEAELDTRQAVRRARRAAAACPNGAVVVTGGREQSGPAAAGTDPRAGAGRW